MSRRFRSPNRNIAKFLGKTEETNTSDASLATLNDISGAGGGSLTVYDSIGTLPLSSVTEGSMAFVNSNSRMYVHNGTGWYSATVVNTSPTWSSEPNGSYEVVDSATPLVITALATDPEGIPITHSGVASDSAQYLFSSISQDSSVYTFTPLTESQLDSNVSAGFLTETERNNFTYTFRASDGINILSKDVTINYDISSLPSGYIELETFSVGGSYDGYVSPHSIYPFVARSSNGAATFLSNGVRGRITKNGSYDAGWGKRYSFVAGKTYTFKAHGLYMFGMTARLAVYVGGSLNSSSLANLGEWTSNGDQTKAWLATSTGDFWVTIRSVTTNTGGYWQMNQWDITHN
jgi:hypothetical protein